MADEEVATKKKGLHGWRAAVAVFGCGSLAAFGVFGVVVGLLGTFLSTLADGVDADSPPAELAQTSSQPREEFREDIFDFCDIITDISAVSIALTSEVGRPEDTSVDGGDPKDDDLVRSDQCAGIMRPASSSAEPWDFEFSYRAIIYSTDDDREEISASDLEDWRAEVQTSGMSVAEDGEISMADEAYYYYGEPASGPGTRYVVVARKRSAVFTIELNSPNDISPTVFEGEVLKMDARLDNDFGQFIPR
ncbi:hypothetical protein DFP74_6565 [Nocardiopsis sp. Huas11]|uniref:hypothetical protein n=1 Tax=Nocardiopsis sp. Huas11 TaxID=2183912 RepID=UPI000F11863E|nr:hypothetical protein [Nocardiopsis sp. Huas11]RKS10783.1 hypothetical protein DFP74_6565 [Nocardiopsis sp. Huas11]